MTINLLSKLINIISLEAGIPLFMLKIEGDQLMKIIQEFLYVIKLTIMKFLFGTGTGVRGVLFQF